MKGKENFESKTNSLLRDGNYNQNNQNNNPQSLISNNKQSEGELIDVVIGMAQKTDPKNLVVFCASLRK